MKQQGSALIIALALMIFITTLGTIVLQTAHSFHALSIERALHRPAQIILESLTAYACRTQGLAWYKICIETSGKQPHETYTVKIHETVCTLRVAVEKGDVVIEASCLGARATQHKLRTFVPRTYKNQAEKEIAAARAVITPTSSVKKFSTEATASLLTSDTLMPEIKGAIKRDKR